MRLATFASFFAIPGLLVAPLPAVGQEAGAVYKPTSQWSLDYGDDYCRLARSFSDGKGTVAVAFERIQPGPFMRLILVSDSIRPFRSADTLGWHFTPSDPERKTPYTKSQTLDGHLYYNLGMVTLERSTGETPGPFIVRRDSVSSTPISKIPGDTAKNIRPPSPTPYDRTKEQTAGKNVTGFVIDAGLDEPLRVETGELGAPIGALQACADDLAKSWGLDSVKLQTEKSPAIPDGEGIGWLPQGTIGFADFPKLSGGSNQVRLMVDATGNPTACAIHWPTLDATTNDKICKILMAKAKFTTAKDAAGQAMPGYWIGSPLFLGPPMKGFGR